MKEPMPCHCGMKNQFGIGSICWQNTCC